MKAKIIECRKQTILERIKHLALIQGYVTVWELETGEKVTIPSTLEGGDWTSIRLEAIVCPKKKLTTFIGYETEICDQSVASLGVSDGDKKE